MKLIFPFLAILLAGDTHVQYKNWMYINSEQSASILELPAKQGDKIIGFSCDGAGPGLTIGEFSSDQTGVGEAFEVVCDNLEMRISPIQIMHASNFDIIRYPLAPTIAAHMAYSEECKLYVGSEAYKVQLQGFREAAQGLSAVCKSRGWNF